MTLYRALYVSRSRLCPHESDAFDRLVAAAAERNARYEVSGVLAAAHGAFLQLVEADRDVLFHLLAAIARDPRHDAMTVIDARPAAWRLYPRWGMAGLRLGADPESHFSFEDLTELSAKQLYAMLVKLQPVETARLDAPIETLDSVLL
ncbi:MAG: BLUF domain-containing protein [Oceanicaulis sp.]